MKEYFYCPECGSYAFPGWYYNTETPDKLYKSYGCELCSWEEHGDPEELPKAPALDFETLYAAYKEKIRISQEISRNRVCYKCKEKISQIKE